VRTTLYAALVVGVTLAGAAVAMVFLLERSLTDDVERTARFQAASIEDQLAGGTDIGELPLRDQEDEFAQVLDGEGNVILASENVTGRPALALLEPGDTVETDVVLEEEEEDEAENEPFLVVASAAETADGEVTILTGRALESVRESVDVVVNLLLIGLPLLLLVLSAVTWGVVGKALAPVESIRSEVDEISTEELHRRVPNPDSGDEISRLAGTMNQMLARLEAGIERQRRFVSDASHELRNPVASIRQHAEVAIAHPEGSTADDLARVVLEEDLRLQRLVEDLLLLARMDERRAEGAVATVDLDDLVFDEVARVRSGADRTIDTSRVSAGRVVGDRKRLSRLVANLLDNGLRHSRRSVAISLAEEGDSVVLRVDDDGKGIEPGERERIFDRFVRLQEARDRDSGGSGLGLAIVAEVAGAHGATATVLDSPYGGARFEVRFPRRGD
jgi:signal transduction histidine kinase